MAVVVPGGGGERLFAETNFLPILSFLASPPAAAAGTRHEFADISLRNKFFFFKSHQYRKYEIYFSPRST